MAEALKGLRSLTSAKTEEVFDVELQNLEEAEVWNNSNFKNYVTKRWLPVQKAFQSYLEMNIKATSSSRKYHDSIPTFLHDLGEAIHPLIEGVQDEVINYVEAGDDHYRCDLATPVFVLNELGYNSITVWLTGSMADQNNNPPTSEKPNVFTVLKNAARQYLSYPESREEKNQKDVLFNKVVACLKNNNVGFTPLQVNTTGLTVATNLTSVLWFMDDRHSRFKNRGINLPEIESNFDLFKGLFDLFQITAGDLEENIDKLGQLLIMPWILNPKFATFKTAVENLSDGLKSTKAF
ncbi:hypothetical protein MAR_030629 [Mya arenaria]|uniref:Uncharacterized protein n=1 Tax=Mya arenaria TaxID=6604 RepID=A0ABY7F1I0_MYAAR|nr:hypothetical protein MAR_030629 [Mya arenaria]